MPDTEIVTLLFTDLVGSTEMFGRIGEDSSDPVRRAHFQRLRDALPAHQGREVKNLGDGLMCVFPAASSALAAAVAMQRGVERDNRRSPEVLGLRVGIHSGEVTVEGDDYFGTPVVVAERLCKVAGSGQILVSEVVRALTGTRGGHNFLAVGAIQLKGLVDAVDAVEVVWEPETSAVGGIPMPPTLGHERQFFVGREDERERLRSAFKLATTGSRTVVFLSGEPGVGKTRLATELAFDVAESGGVVLYGRCDADLSIPYQPFAEALRHYASFCAATDLEAHVSVHRGELTRVVPDIVERVAGVPPPIEERADLQSDPEGGRSRVLDAAADLVLRAAQGRPLLLVLDDLHWAARPTLSMLRHLLRRSDGSTLMILGTYRDTDLVRTHPLADTLADLRRTRDAERIALSGLDEEGVVAFVEAAGGERLDDDGLLLARAIQRETDGNPFFVGQVLRHLIEAGRVVRRDDRWAYEGDVELLGIPEGVREVVGRRVSSLSETANRLLHVAAVAGMEFDLAVIGHALDGVGREQLIDAAEEAAAARIVSELASFRYRFTHSLVRQTLYEELSSARRALMHQRVGEAIEALKGADDAYLPALARHFSEAARAGDVSKAAAYAARAARHAIARAAYEDAVLHAEAGLHALELDRESDAQVAELDVIVAEAKYWLGEGTEAHAAVLRAIDAARSAGSAVSFGWAAYWYTQTATPGGAFTQAREICEEAIRLLGDAEPHLRSRLLAMVALWARQNAAADVDVDALTRESVELGSSGSSPADAIVSRVYRAVLTLNEGPLDANIALLDEAVDIGRATDESTSFRNALTQRGVARLSAGDRGGFERDLLESSSLDKFRGRMSGSIGIGMRATTATLDGRFDEAAGLIDEYSEMVGNFPLLVYTAGARLGWLHIERGRLDEASEICRLGIVFTPRVASWSAALAALHAEGDNMAECRRVLADVAADDYALVRFGDYRHYAGSKLAESCAWADDAGLARFLHETTSGYAGRICVVGLAWACGGSTDRTLGIASAVLARHDEARGHFEAALALETRASAPVLVARTRYWYGWALRRAGAESAAQEQLALASASARELGMVSVAAMADRLR